MNKLKKMTSILLAAVLLNLSLTAISKAAEATPTTDVKDTVDVNTTSVTANSSDITSTNEATEAVITPITEAVENTTTSKVLDTNGVYHAALGVQTCNMLWIGRWGYYDTENNPTFGTDKFGTLFSGAEKTNNYVEYAGIFQDTTIEGNGTYTISLSDADFANETSLSQLFIATNIPLNDKIKFTELIVKMNGRTLVTFDEGYQETDQKYTAGGMVILAINHWRAPLEEYLINNGLYVEGNGIECLKGSGDDNIEITFTVSGFTYDKVVEEVIIPSEEPTAVPIVNNENTDSDQSANEDINHQTIPALLIIITLFVAVVIIVVIMNKRKK